MEESKLKNDLIRHIRSRNKTLSVEILGNYSFDELLCHIDPNYREYFLKQLREVE